MKVNLIIDNRTWNDLDLKIAKGIIRDEIQEKLLNEYDSIQIKLEVKNG